MKKLLSLLLIFFIATSGTVLYGQGCEDSSDDEDGIKLFGYLQTEYDYILSDPPESTFKFKRARIGVRGDIPYDFSYYVMIENSAFVSRTGNPYLLDAFISYKRFEWANIAVGSFKQPFGLEVNTPCHSLHTIERSLVSDQLVVPQRDMGLYISGGAKDKYVKYAGAIMNGTGLGTKDNNSKKDFIGRATFYPVEFIGIGGSYRYGYPNNDSTIRISYAVELEVDYANFLLQAEYVADEGDYNRAAGGGCGSEPMILGKKRNGYWIQAMYMTPWMLQPVLKFEAFDADQDIDNNNIYWFTGGLNYWFNDWVRLQLNYQYKAEKGAEVKNDAILVQLQVKF